MITSDWDEVKRLAADFRRAQLTSTSQILSERNCIEIITKLIELNLLDVIFTADGKEYITPQYLLKEIKDEIYVSGGRVNLIELSKSLNVDLCHITGRIPEIEKSLSGCSLVIGHLITKSYQQTIANEINEKLQTLGRLNVGDLTKIYDLPGDFLQEIVEKNLGKVIVGKQDKSDRRLFFTEAFVQRNKCIVRGCLRAITKPIQMSAILSILQLESRDFHFAFDGLAEEKEVCGSLTARQGGNATFVPYIYTKQINEWVNNFFAQNGYLEYDALIRLGITEPKSFLRRHFPASSIIELNSCAIGTQLLSQVEAAIEETLRTGSYIDVLMLVPSTLNTNDIKSILNEILKKYKNAKGQIFCESVFVSEQFLEEVCKPFLVGGLLESNAHSAVNSGAYIQAQAEKKLGRSLALNVNKVDVKSEKREERRRRAAGGKSGGGAQGRETKTKSVKKRGGNKGEQSNQVGQESDSDNEVVVSKKEALGRLEIISVQEVEDLLNEKQSELADIDGLVAAIAAHLQPVLNKEAIKLAGVFYEQTLVSSVGSRKRAHVDLQDRVDTWLMELRMSDRAIKLFPDKDDQAKLSIHVIKTIGVQLVNSVISYAAQDVNFVNSQSQQQQQQPPLNTDKEFTAEMRIKLVGELSDEVREPLAKLNKCLAGSSLDEFLLAIEPALNVVGLLNRKPDKKKEKQHLQVRREHLLSELVQTDSASTVLLVGLQLIFQVATQNMLNVVGKFVPIVLPFIKGYLAEEHYKTLLNFQDLVVQSLATNENEEMQIKLKSSLNEALPQVKEICLNFKKTLGGVSERSLSGN